MELLSFMAIIVLVFFPYQYYKLRKELKYRDIQRQQEKDFLAWKYDSDLKLLQKTVKVRFANIAKQNKKKEEEYKATITSVKKKEDETKKSYDDMISEVTRYKVWKLTIKPGMESTIYPDKAIIIAETKEVAEQLMISQYNLEDVEALYDIVQSRRKKNEILLASYNIL